MDNFPVSFNPGETIIRCEENAKHVKNSPLGLGYNVIFGTLWLTNQRIVFRSFPLGGITAYPLAHLRAAEALPVTIYQRTSRYSSRSYDSALRLEFDNGGREYFITENIPDWAAAILEARIGSPTLAYTQTPPLTSAVEQGSRGCWVMAGIFAGIFLLFICSASGCLVLTILVGTLGGSGK